MEVLHIYHTNDVHSHFEHWPKIHQLVTERKKWHEQEGDECLVFDIGDHMDRWHPFSDGMRGKGSTELLNAAGYDAVTFGNNEGITLAYEDLDTMYEERNFKVLAANFYRKDGTRPEWAEPYETYVTKSGTRIGVIGLTVFYAHFYDLLGWQVKEPLEELQTCLSQLKDQTDFIIVLSHLGIHEDERMAEMYPEIDVILGGHTHHILHEGKVVGNALLGAAGKHGSYTGHAIIEIDPTTKEVHSKKAQLYNMNEWDAADNEKDQIKALYDRGKQLLEQPVVHLTEPLPADLFEDSALASLLCRELKDWCEADCAMINAGLLLDGLSPGVVTDFDLLSICPHPINPCTVELTGTELKEVLLETRDEKWAHLQVKGLGFRGTLLGTFVYDDIELKEMENHSTEIYIKSQPLESKRIYTLAIPDMLTFGRFFPAIYRCQKKKYYLPEFLRDLLKNKLLELYG